MVRLTGCDDIFNWNVEDVRHVAQNRKDDDAHHAAHHEVGNRNDYHVSGNKKCRYSLSCISFFFECDKIQGKEDSLVKFVPEFVESPKADNHTLRDAEGVKDLLPGAFPNLGDIAARNVFFSRIKESGRLKHHHGLHQKLLRVNMGGTNCKTCSKSFCKWNSGVAFYRRDTARPSR